MADLADGKQHRLVDLIRHGEVAGGACFRGRRDDPLSAAGWTQLKAATGIDGPSGTAPWDRILCSPAARCAIFAEWLGEHLGLSIEQVEGLRERDFGAWEGLRADQIPLDDLGRFWADPAGYDPPDSEPFATFRRRVIDGWHQVLRGGGDRLLLITHGGVIRAILGEVLGIPAARLILLEVPPACHSRLRIPIEAGLPSLIAHGKLGA